MLANATLEALTWLAALTGVVLVGIRVVFEPADLERMARRIVQRARWTADETWLRWLKRGTNRLHRVMDRIYGRPDRAGRRPWTRYLTPLSFRMSCTVAASYLFVGGVMAMLWGLTTTNFAKIGALWAFVIVSGSLIPTAFVACILRKKLIAAPRRPGAKLPSVVRAVFMSALAPVTVLALTAKIGDGSGEQSVWTLAWTAIAVSLIATATYASAVGLFRAFHYYLPIALLLYVLASVPVLHFALDIVGGPNQTLMQTLEDMDSSDFVHALAFIVLLVYSLELDFAPSLKRILPMAAASAFAVLSWPLVRDFGRAPRVWLDGIGTSNVSIKDAYLSVGTVFSLVCSMVYANALCDQISVAVTRFLLVVMGRAKSATQFAKLFLLDAVLAGGFVVATYAVFTALAHVILLALPAEEFLRALRSVATGLAAAGGVQAAEGMEGFGMNVAKFTILFGLTACVPTVLHGIVLVGWALSRVVLSRLAYPAKLLVARWDQSKLDGSASQPVINLVLAISVFAVITAIFIGFLAAESLVKQLLLSPPLPR